MMRFFVAGGADYRMMLNGVVWVMCAGDWGAWWVVWIKCWLCWYVQLDVMCIIVAEWQVYVPVLLSGGPAYC